MTIRSGIRPGIRSGIRSGVNPSYGGTPQRRFPVSLAEWAQYFPSLPVPIGIWTLQEAASPIDDKVGAHDLSQNQAILYQQAGDPEPTLAPRRAVGFDTASTNEWLGCADPGDAAFGNIPAGGTRFLLVRFANPDNAATSRSIAGKGSGAAIARWGLQLVATTGVLRAVVGDGTNSAQANSVSAYDDGAWHDAAFGVDAATDAVRLVTETENISAALGGALNTTLDGSGIAPAASLRAGAAVGLSPTVGLAISYMALFDAVFSAAHLAAFRTEL